MEEGAVEEVMDLRNKLESMEAKVATLEARLVEAEANTNRIAQTNTGTVAPVDDHLADKISGGEKPHGRSVGSTRWPLSPGEYTRYGRQMIMPEIGLEGQLSLKKSRVLVVGLGGLGCPAATYLAGAGVGVIGLVDDDDISLSNLHRQTLYTENHIGKSKAQIALYALQKSNSATEYQTHNLRLTPAEAIELFAEYDIVLDCTDHPSSRYFISDAAVLTARPLVSASALRTEGQLLVLNHPPSDRSNCQSRFCYRCVFPKPPPPESITTCGEGGILGPVVGVMGVLMAMEAIKIVTLHAERTRNESDTPIVTQPSLLLYSAYSNPLFRTIRLKGKRADCISCSKNATITRESLNSGSLDYVAFCGIATNPNVLSAYERISVRDYAALQEDRTTPQLLIDVREPVEFDIGHIQKSMNLPLSKINRDPEGSLAKLEKVLDADSTFRDRKQLYFICKLGNDSQVAIAKLRDLPQFRNSAKFECKGDIRGGLWQWKEHVDPSFPDYAGFPATNPIAQKI